MFDNVINLETSPRMAFHHVVIIPGKETMGDTMTHIGIKKHSVQKYLGKKRRNRINSIKAYQQVITFSPQKKCKSIMKIAWS